MPSTPRLPVLKLSFAILALLAASTAYAGPPFVTDDPEPVELHHWEIYLATQQYHSADGWSGALPQMEVNYGALPDLQLHIIAPFAYNSPKDAPSHNGYGDTELGFKYRFVHETDSMPMVGIFPLVELPTGSLAQGLGNGKAQVFLPLWLQKTIGAWSSYGGGGYWINPGDGNRDYWYAGWQVQRKLTEKFAAGVEVQFRTPQTVDSGSSTALNAGAMWDLTDTYHLLFSAGHTVQGRSQFQGYLALQMTLGPEEEKDKDKASSK